MKPKRYIAWDTSSPTGIVCAFEEHDKSYRIVAEWTLSLETSKHSERLLWTIDTVLESAGWKLEDIAAIGVGVGPGSFTGLRIGITTAKMLASQLNIPVVPVSSLAILARGAVRAVQAHPKAGQTLILALQDAAKGEWFTLMGPAKAVKGCVVAAEGDRPGIWARGVKERTIAPEDFLEEAQKLLKKSKTTPWVAIGVAVQRYGDLLKVLPKKQRIDVDFSFDPRVLAQIVWEGVQQGILRTSMQIKPRYLRESDAEVKLKKGLLRPAPLIHRTGIA
ncbi:MAG: tRNA (adenosine(37)-N6)-threonylcarbamoyltransferase complex dimerization subunit type 1 TsaB [Bdellovibrionales bacterium]|nr:tRNA (adenosine(37)-N6)-threonylcarbamoyltransferase complex dimerization subunit type 1 TsaB [Bdellovibrionales bacterium]